MLVEKALPIDQESINNLIQIRINIYYDDVELLAEKVFTGDISIGQWEEAMKKAIRELHTAVVAITKGGWENVTFQEWGRLGTPLREQYKFLHKFAGDIAENKDTISLKMIQARARLYGKAAWNTSFLFQAGPEFEKVLPWIPRDGSTECLVGCMCRWELQIIATTESKIKVRAVWKICDAEHCATCRSRNNHVEIIEVPIGTDVPDIIGSRC